MAEALKAEDLTETDIDNDIIFESKAVYLCRTGSLRLKRDKLEVIDRDGNVKETFDIDKMSNIKRRGYTCIVWDYGDNSFESHIAILDFQRDNWLDVLDKATSGRYDEILYA